MPLFQANSYYFLQDHNRCTRGRCAWLCKFFYYWHWANCWWNTIYHQIQHYIQHHIQHHIRKYKNNSILVPFWAIIDHKNVFTQDTLHTSFISQKNLRSPSQTLLQTSTFYCIFNSFCSGWGVLCFKQTLNS